MKHQTYETTLSSGSRLAIVHVSGAPIFQLETFVNSGFRYAPIEQYELPHLLEHLAFEGSGRFPDPQVLRYELERYGIYSNAFTNFYMNGYVLYGPMEYWKHITDLSFEWLLEPTFTQQAIDEQKQVVDNELSRKKSNAESWTGMYMYQTLKNGLVPDYTSRIRSLQAITRQSIVDYHKHYYQPKNLLHIVTGDVPKNRVAAITHQIESAVSGLKPGAHRKNPLVVPNAPTKVFHKTDYPYEDSVRFNLMFFKPGFTRSTYDRVTVPLRIFDTILNGGLYSRIFTKSRAAGLSYTVGSGFGVDRESWGIEFWDKCQPQQLEPLVRLILDEVAAVAHGEFSDEELTRAIGYQVGQHATRFQTALNYTSWYDSVYVDGMPMHRPEDFVAELKRVDRAAIVDVAKRLFVAHDPHRMLVVSSQHAVSAALRDSVEAFGV